MRNITIDPWKLLIGVCLFIKPLMFYRLMDIQVNLLFLWVATAFMLSLMFGSFKNLWIPFGLYVLLTILMFCDVTHNAYFSGYISLKLIASAKFLGDAGDAVIAVIRPEFWLLFLDLPLVALSIVKIRRGEWLSSIRKEWFSGVLLLAAVFFLVFGSVSASSTLRSVGNLEFFSVRVKDLLETTTSFGSQQAELDEESVYLVEEDQEDSLFGIAEGRNLIVIQMEALQNFVINREYEGQEITPNLNRLIARKERYILTVTICRLRRAILPMRNLPQ